MATTVRSRKSARRQRLEAAINYPIDWLEERSGLIGALRWFLFRKVPGDTNWMQTLGFATLTAFLVQALTGAIFALIGLHLYLVMRLGVSSPPWSREAAGADWVEREVTTNGRRGLTQPRARSSWRRNGGDES